MRNSIARFVMAVLINVLSLFFERQFLAGRYFKKSHGGYLWAFRSIWLRNFLRISRPYPWPVALGCHISDPRNIEFHPDDLNNFQSPGTYYQNVLGKIRIGRGTYIGPNVGIITANHDPLNPSSHLPGGDVSLGEECWIGMNSVILPGITLGSNTVVGAGSVVTKSFPNGRVVLVGSPARVVRDLPSPEVRPGAKSVRSF